MTWFGVSIIISTRLKHGKQKKIPIYENVVLVEAKTSKEAAKNAAKLAKSQIVVDNSLTLDNKPAYLCFEGIRKVVNVSNPEPLSLDKQRPINGTEITYSEFIINYSDIEKLIEGKEVKILYRE